MIYLLALIGAFAVSYLVWKAFGPQGVQPAPSRGGPIGPDDDTDFLLDLGNEGRAAGDDPQRDDPRPGATT